METRSMAEKKQPEFDIAALMNYMKQSEDRQRKEQEEREERQRREQEEREQRQRKEQDEREEKQRREQEEREEKQRREQAERDERQAERDQMLLRELRARDEQQLRLMEDTKQEFLSQIKEIDGTLHTEMEETKAELRHEVSSVSQRLDAVQREMYDLVSRSHEDVGSSIHRPTPHDQRPIQRPLVYDGRLPWPSYHAQFEIAAKINHWTEAQKANFLATSLSGQALTVLGNLTTEQQGEYASLVTALSNRFGGDRTGEMAKVKLSGRIRARGESLAALASDIDSLIRQAYPNGPQTMWDALAREYFVNALRDTDLQRQVKLSRSLTLQDALAAAQEFEAINESLSVDRPSRQDTRRYQVREVRASTPARSSSLSRNDSDLGEELAEVKRLLVSFSRGLNRNQNRTAGRESNRSRDKCCYYCKESGHFRNACPRLREATAEANPSSEN